MCFREVGPTRGCCEGCEHAKAKLIEQAGRVSNQPVMQGF